MVLEFCMKCGTRLEDQKQLPYAYMDDKDGLKRGNYCINCLNMIPVKTKHIKEVIKDLEKKRGI